MNKNQIEALSKKIFIKTKKLLSHSINGNNNSLFIGEGIDFHEIREYRQGDDVRKINWKTTLKMNGNPHVNTFKSEKKLNVINVFLIDGNIEYGNKKEIMTEVSALTSLSSINNLDDITNIFYSNKKEKIFNTSKKSSMILELIKYSLNLNTINKKIDFNNLFNFLNKTIKKRSIIFLIGDFHNSEIDFKKLNKKHEIYSIIIREKTEEKPLFNGDTNILNPNNSKSNKINFNKKIIDKFILEIKSRDEIIKKKMNLSKIKYKKIYTDENVFFNIKKLFREA